MFRDREVHIQDHRGAVLQEAVVRALIQGQLIRPVFTARAPAPVHVHVLVPEAEEQAVQTKTFIIQG